MPLCSDCRSQAEFTTTGSGEQCSRCGQQCDNCDDPFRIPTSPGARVGGVTTADALRDPIVAYILGAGTMALVWMVVILL